MREQMSQVASTAGPDSRPVKEGQLVVFGTGHRLVMRAACGRAEPLDVLLLGRLGVNPKILLSCRY
jgi:hypothetical protein